MPEFFFRNLKRTYPTVKSARGVWVTDTDGKTYLDGASGAIAANLGHGLKEINEAVAEQMAAVSFAHTSQFVSEPGLKLAAQLVGMTPPEFRKGARAYFTSGGSESIETAIKMARGYFVERGETSRHLVIARWHGYHGSTMGALSVTGHPARRKPYIPLLADQPRINPAYPYRCPCKCAPGSCTSESCALALAGELEAAIVRNGPENVMAFIGEPIVGAALGAAVPHDAYWPRVREICTKYGVLLIADEVMTGLGRAGANFALDLWQVEPDIIALGKGLSAGYLPLGAVLAGGRVVSAYEQGTGVFEHGFTYSGHPAACAAGVAAVDYLAAHDLVRAVSLREGDFMERMRALTSFRMVGDVRGRGFMAGFELVRDRATKEPFPAQMRISQVIARQAAENGLLVYPGSGSIDGVLGDHVMVAPPFTVSDAEVDELFSRLARTLAAVEASVGALS